MKWNPINPAEATALTAPSGSPGVVFPLSLSDLPFKGMPGAVSYFGSGYIVPQALEAAKVTVGGELVVIRTDGPVVKGYNFAFASSTDGRVYFCGPFKDFPTHHSPSGSPAPVQSMFGHVKFGPTS